MKGIINVEWLATEISGLIYSKGKAKMFNVLESQMETTVSLGAMGDTPKMRAVKRITEDLLETISKQAAQLIRDTLGDWEEDVMINKNDLLAPGTIQYLEPNDAESELLMYPADKAATMASRDRLPSSI